MLCVSFVPAWKRLCSSAVVAECIVYTTQTLMNPVVRRGSYMMKCDTYASRGTARKGAMDVGRPVRLGSGEER